MKNIFKRFTIVTLTAAIAISSTMTAFAVDETTLIQVESEQAVQVAVSPDLENATYAYLRNLGYSHAGTCGIMGNIAAESGFEETSRGYFGLMDDRWEVYLDYCDDQRFVPTAIGPELAYMDYRLGESNAEARKMVYSTLKKLLHTTDDPSLAAAAFCVGYERSMDLNVNSRNVYPDEFKEEYWPYDYHKDISYQLLTLRERTAEMYADEYEQYRNNWEELGNPYIDVPSGLFYTEPVDWAFVYGLIDQSTQMGVSSTRFRPENSCSRAQFVQLLWNAAGQPEPASEDIPFKDVTSSFFTKAIAWAYEQGITSGTSATTFSPNLTCTRAQIVQFLWNAAGQPRMESFVKNPFSDVRSNAWYYNAVLWACRNSVTAGTSATTFTPNRICSKGETVTFLYRYDGLWNDTNRNCGYPY
ncbi:MAG: phage tail tip lysozyme [Eubacteriales bacterium]|nr:phage tail tip lysozyme [Eubacteriales bacterium]